MSGVVNVGGGECRGGESRTIVLMQKGLILYDSLFHIFPNLPIFFCTEFALVSAPLEMSHQLILAVETELGTFDADKLPLILLPEKEKNIW